MADFDSKWIGEDALFKLLTWDSPAISQIFGLPEIVGVPHQQEFARATERRVDRLYDLLDGSLLNVEHQSSLNDREALARRLIEYRCLIRERFPAPRIIRQVVVFTGSKPKNRALIGDLAYRDMDEHGGGVQFSVQVRDFLGVPVEVFRKFGRLDDLILGVLASGARDRDYMAKLKARAVSIAGEEGKIARGKLYAACVIRGDEPVIQNMIAELDMWIDDVKDNPVAQRFIEIASRERVAAAEQRGKAQGAAEILVHYAVGHNVGLLGSTEETESALTTYADWKTLSAMVEDMPNMAAHADIASFMRRHGVEIPGRGM